MPFGRCACLRPHLLWPPRGRADPPPLWLRPRPSLCGRASPPIASGSAFGRGPSLCPAPTGPRASSTPRHGSTSPLGSGAALKTLQGTLTTFKGMSVRVGSPWSCRGLSPPSAPAGPSHQSGRVILASLESPTLRFGVYPWGCFPYKPLCPTPNASYSYDQNG